MLTPIVDPPATTSTRRSTIRRAARLLFALLVMGSVGYALWSSWRDLQFDALPSGVWLLPLAVALAVRFSTSNLLALTWLLLFRSMGGRLPVREGFRIYLVSNIAKYVPGKVMLVAGRAAMVQERGQSASLGVTSTLLEAGFSLLSAACVGVVAFVLAQAQPAAQEERLASWTGVAMLLVLGAGLIGLHPRILGTALGILTRLAPKRLALELGGAPAYRTSLLVFGAHVTSRTVGVGAIFAILNSVYPVDAAWLPLLAGASAAGYLFGVVVPFAPGGIGAREGLMTLLLATVMPAPVAAIVSVLDRLVSVVAELLAAGLAMVVAGRSGEVLTVPMPTLDPVADAVAVMSARSPSAAP